MNRGEGEGAVSEKREKGKRVESRWSQNEVGLIESPRRAPAVVPLGATLTGGGFGRLIKIIISYPSHITLADGMQRGRLRRRTRGPPCQHRRSKWDNC